MNEVAKADVNVMDRFEELHKRLCSLMERMAPYLDSACDECVAKDSAVCSPIVTMISRLESMVNELHHRLVV